MPRNIRPVQRRSRGFEQTAALVRGRIRAAGEKRGFAVTRLLTRWDEIVGPRIARTARPVKVAYRKDGFGATLTLLTTGGHAPLVEMQKDSIREKVNACYGYNAISRIRITQTAPEGFAEGQADFAPAPAAAAREAAPQLQEQAREMARSVGDDGLRAALEALGRNVLTRDRTPKGTRHDD